MLAEHRCERVRSSTRALRPAPVSFKRPLIMQYLYFSPAMSDDIAMRTVAALMGRGQCIVVSCEKYKKQIELDMSGSTGANEAVVA